jgi:hypothetical protein
MKTCPCQDWQRYEQDLYEHALFAWNHDGDYTGPQLRYCSFCGKLLLEFTSEWEDDLIWCPSQLTRTFLFPETGATMELYCRWRHQDPWTFAILFHGGRIRLGEGLCQTDPIPKVYAYTEKLLQEYLLKVRKEGDGTNQPSLKMGSQLILGKETHDETAYQ